MQAPSSEYMEYRAGLMSPSIMLFDMTIIGSPYLSVCNDAEPL